MKCIKFADQWILKFGNCQMFGQEQGKRRRGKKTEWENIDAVRIFEFSFFSFLPFVRKAGILRQNILLESLI